MVALLIKKFLVSVFIICFFTISADALNEKDISAQSAVVLNSQTYEVVFEKNAYEKRSMASTTKIMTAVLAVESGKLNQIVSITPEMCGAEGTSIGLKSGYKISLYNLVCAMMLESGNDAANSVAIYLGGSLDKFAEMMNKKASAIGMKNTSFVTPSGLDSENHYSTAYDMALLGAYAMKNSVLKEISSTKSMRAELETPDIALSFSNHNKMLSYYEGSYGIKTGFTKKSGRCLVSAAEKSDGNFIAVTLNAPNDWKDHKILLDYAFESSKKQEAFFIVPDKISVQGGTKNSVEISTDNESFTFMYSEDVKIKQKIYMPKFVYAPVRKGETLGYVELIFNNEVIYKTNITAKTDVSQCEETFFPKQNIFTYLKNKFNEFFNK